RPTERACLALRYRRQVQDPVQDGDAPAAEVLHLGERVVLAALVRREQRLTGIEAELTRPERPALRTAVRDQTVRLQLRDEALERRPTAADARPRPDRRVERRRVAVVLDEHALTLRAYSGGGPSQYDEHH